MRLRAPGAVLLQGTEGLSMLDEKVERFRDEVHQEFGKVDRRFLHLDARIAVLERR